MLRRLIEELRGRHDRVSVAQALEALRIDGAGTVDRTVGTLLDEATPVALVTIARGVYATTPTRAGRRSLLAQAARLAPVVRVHVPVVTGARLGRLVLDAPRRLLPTSAEPGDRFGARFTHATFDDEELVGEAAWAGLAFARREGSWVVLERGPVVAEPAAPFAFELRCALATVREAERQRQRSPAEAVATMRRRGAMEPVRGPIGRARLRRAIGWVDAAYVRPPPNCFRRVLTEIALDGGAAREAIVFGLDVGRTGHVAFEGAEDLSFDVAFAIPPG